MAVQTVTGKITNPDGTLGKGADIRFVLSQAALIPGSEEMVPAVVDIQASKVDATFSVQLQANIDLTPGGTFWTAYVNTGAPGGQAIWTPIIVPHGGGEMGNLVGAIPAVTPGPGHVSALTVDAAATFTAGPITFPANSIAANAVIGMVGPGGDAALHTLTLIPSGPPWNASDDAFAAGAFGGKVASGASQRFENFRPQSTSTATGNPGGSGVQHGPFGVEVGDTFFVDTQDSVCYYGYNMAAGGTKKVSAEPYLGYVVESDYNDGATHKMEQYFEYKSPDGLISFRPLFFQYDRSKAGAANTNVALSTAWISGNPFHVYLPDLTEVARFPQTTDSAMHFYGLAGGDFLVTANSPTGFNSHYQFLANSVNVGELRMATTTMMALDVATHNVVNVQSPGATGGLVEVNSGTFRASLGAVGGSASGYNTTPAIVAEAGSTQTGDIFQVVNNGAATVYFGVSSAGVPKIGAASNEATGAGTPLFGSNSPAVTNTAPYKWFKFLSSDGSTVYIPAWK